VCRERIELEKKQKEKAKKDAEMQRKEQAEREKEEAVAEAKRQEKLFAERMLQSICIEVKIGKENSVSVQIVWGSTVLQLKQLLSREHMGNADLKAHALVGEGKVSLENSATLLASGVVGGSKLKLVDVVAKAQKKAAQELQMLQMEEEEEGEEEEEEDAGGGEKKKKKKSAGGGGGSGKPKKEGKAPQSKEDRFVLAEKKLPESTVRATP
jgi:predicted component of type VI protein secretion system